MKKLAFIFIGFSIFLGNLAFAVTIQEPCEVVREFNCSFHYTLNDNGQQYSGTAKMLDYKYLFAGAACEVFQSKLDFGTSVFVTEDDNNANDTEESRDSRPDSHSGWGGKEFFMTPTNDLAIMTSARQEQKGKDVREYDIFLLTPQENADPKLIGSGTMSCQK